MSETTTQQHLAASEDAQPPLSGTRAVREALGPNAVELLAAHRAEGGTVGAFSAAVEEAARDADRLHCELRDYADDVRRRLPELSKRTPVSSNCSSTPAHSWQFMLPAATSNETNSTAPSTTSAEH